MYDAFVQRVREILDELSGFPEDKRIEILNEIRQIIHKYSPFASEPVDCLQWVPAGKVLANDYNPNSVAPPEMELLERSIQADGYTQPIVVWADNGHFEVVDGFHRNRVGKESLLVKARVRNFLPVVVINSGREERGDRIAATIRHNRARGKHTIDGMAKIVIELKRRNWSDGKIGRELGMDPDEVLRLAQITGLAEMFANREFSQAWEASNVHDINDEDDLDILKEDSLDENVGNTFAKETES